MRCPTLSELPSPPPGKPGWPWTEESEQLPDTMPDGSPWPRVSIVTPSYNQGQFIEETIRSVLLQGYPDLEYIVIDGGSTDGSVDIIRKYERWLTYWVSERDAGQSDAINKGLRKATGEIVGWLNSDDTYLPGTLRVIAELMVNYPDIAMVYGGCNYVDESSQLLRPYIVEDFDLARLIHRHDYIPQPAAFFRRHVLEEVGFLDTSLHYAIDYDLWLRIARKFKVVHIPQTLATYRLCVGTKTASHSKLKLRLEELKVGHKYGRSWLKWLQYWLPAFVRYRSKWAMMKICQALPPTSRQQSGR